MARVNTHDCVLILLNVLYFMAFWLLVQNKYISLSLCLSLSGAKTKDSFPDFMELLMNHSY